MLFSQAVAQLWVLAWCGTPAQGRWLGATAKSAALREVQGLGSSWTFVLQKKGVRVWKRGHRGGDEASFAVRACARFDCTPRELAQILLTRDYELIRRFNPTVVDGTDLEWRDGRKERITYILTKAVAFLRPRDFVCRVRHEVHGTSELIVNTPATHARAPSPRRTVRGELRGTHLVEPAPGGGCLYTCVHEIDPGGAAPRRLVNWFALRKPLQYMDQLRDVAQETYPPGR